MSDDNDMFVLWWWLKNKKKRRYWVHPLLDDKNNTAYQLAKDFKGDDDKFQNFYRMSYPTFKKLREIVEPHIKKKDTNFRRALSGEEKLIITLR